MKEQIKAELILANYDASISKIEIKPNHINSEVIISSKMYDEQTDKETSATITFEDAAAIDFRINLFDSMIGAEACGLYCIKDSKFIESVIKTIFERRKEIFLYEDDYDYDENDEHDMLNCLDISGEFSDSIDEYVAYIQNVDAGVYIIVAKSIHINKQSAIQRKNLKLENIFRILIFVNVILVIMEWIIYRNDIVSFYEGPLIDIEILLLIITFAVGIVCISNRRK